MANREALRQLQSRLAERLQLARSEAPSASWLALECGGQGLLVSLPSAGEIFALAPLLPVPHTQPWFAGVANLRGQLHGVVDLAAFLGLRAGPAELLGAGPGSAAALASHGEARRENARLLALNPALAANIALLVDRLAGLRSGSQLQALDEPAEAAGAARPAFAGRRLRDADGRVWQEIDLAALARHEQFLGIAA